MTTAPAVAVWHAGLLLLCVKMEARGEAVFDQLCVSVQFVKEERQCV